MSVVTNHNIWNPFSSCKVQPTDPFLPLDWKFPLKSYRLLLDSRARLEHSQHITCQHKIEQVSKFKHSASMQTSDLLARAEVSNRLANAANYYNAWLKLSKLHVCDDDYVNRGMKCILYKVIVQSTRYCMPVRYGHCPSNNCTGWRFSR